MSNAIKDNLIGENKTKSQTWISIDWSQVERKVYKLQKRIYKAIQRGDTGAARSLQKTLVNSWAAKVLAVRKVTQDNQGKKTAGIDGVKSLNPSQRMKLVEKIRINDKSKPVRRILIPKANKDEKRPLGIPTMEDRAKQALMKLALEPEWEAKFEPHSYGFRPARSTHDALGYIHNALSGSKEGKWVYDADIAGCFDNINHDYLLDKLNTLPTFRRQIKAWLKSGAITFSNLEPKKEYTPSMAGTPQGGVLSPLLANIALHGLENRLKEWLWNEKKYRIPRWNATDKRMGTEKKERTISSITVVRYADDLLVIHKDKEIIEEAKAVVEEFLKPIGLQIKEAKTKIVHSTEGFDFLGTNIRHYPTGEYRSSKTVKGERTGLTLLIKPSQTSIKKHYRRIAEIINNHNALSQGILIRNLNPIIKGWGNYYKPYVAKEAFSKLDNLIHYRLRRWAKRRHPSKKSTHWIMNRYFDTKKGWQFRDGGITLATHAEIEIERHTIVKGESSIFDGDITYWAKRVKKHPLLNDTELKLMNKQKGICLYCKSKFHEGDLWEVDHRIPRSMGGSKSFSNLQLIHRHCHDAKTREDMNKNRKNSVRNHTQSQEPYEVKVSSTVLETSGSRETDT